LNVNCNLSTIVVFSVNPRPTSNQHTRTRTRTRTLPNPTSKTENKKGEKREGRRNPPPQPDLSRSLCSPLLHHLPAGSLPKLLRRPPHPAAAVPAATCPSALDSCLSPVPPLLPRSALSRPPPPRLPPPPRRS
jgi:hypothetical protein